MFDYELDLLVNYFALDKGGNPDHAELDILLDVSISIYESADPEQLFRLIKFGAWCLAESARINFVGPSKSADPSFSSYPVSDDEVAKALALNGEPAYALCRSPVLLYLAKSIFIDRSEITKLLASTAWWASRTCWIWQHLFVDRRAELRDIQFAKFKFLDDYFSTKQLPVDLKSSYVLEKARVYGYYYEPELATRALEEAMRLTRLNMVHLTGALGRRTKFQVKDVAQLALEDLVEDADVTEENQPSSSMRYPIDCVLQDDTVLDKTRFQAPISQKPLSPIRECALVTFLDNLRQTHSVDDASKEVEKAYVERLLHHPSTYVCKYVALIRRCRLEANDGRRVERALAQAEQLAKEFGSSQSAATTEERLRYFFTVDVPPIWDVRKMEAGLLIGLGCTSEALRISIDLQLWDDAIDCYRRLGMLDRAEAIIREQLDAKPTPHLWCLLGDVVDDESHYRTAWELSGRRLARAQSSLGMHYFVRRRFEDAVKAFDTALAILPLDLKSWYALGCCAMQVKNYQRAAEAYHRCATIDPDSFEAWNNLAACYIHLGDKYRAFLILFESVKCNYENWKVWENYVHVAVDTGHFREAITGVNRLIDLKGKYDDEQVLEILSRVAVDHSQEPAAVPEKPEVAPEAGVDENFLKDLRTLFGRITAKVVNNAAIWRAYSNLHRPLTDSSNLDDWEKYVGLLQKAHQCAVRDSGWTKNDQEIERIVENARRLVEAQLRLAGLLESSSAERSKQMKASARLTLKGVMANLTSAGESDAIRDAVFKFSELAGKFEID